MLGEFATVGAHAIAVAIAFTIITALHIVLGELAPKSLALQRSEETALGVVRPLWPVPVPAPPGHPLPERPRQSRAQALRPAPGDRGGKPALAGGVEAPDRRQPGRRVCCRQAQLEVVARVLTIGDRRIGDIMTPRVDVEWVDIEDKPDEILATIRACQHEQLLVGKGSIDEPLGMILKKDLLDQVLDGKKLDPLAVIRQPLVLHEAMRIFKVLEQFKKAPVRLAIILDEYGELQGIVTQTDLLEAMAGDIPAVEGEEPDVVEREDGSLLIDGMMQAQDAFERLGLKAPPAEGFRTIAGFVLQQLGHLPESRRAFRL